MDFIFYLGLFLAFILIVRGVLFLRKVKKQREIEALRQLFSTLTCEIECMKCGFKGRKEWERGDYIMKDTTFKHFATQVTEKKVSVKKKRLTIKLKRGLCTGNVIIEGIYVEPLPMTKEELKYKQLCDKWR